MKDTTTGTYHYAECGLDYIYLASGFSIVDTQRGRQVVIKNIDGLHALIGLTLTRNKKDLSGREVRFLRQEMLMSQSTLAHLLGVSEQAVHRWEKGKTGTVPKPAENLIRLLYSEHSNRNSKIKVDLKRIADLEDKIDQIMTLRESNSGWKIDKMAA